MCVIGAFLFSDIIAVTNDFFRCTLSGALTVYRRLSAVGCPLCSPPSSMQQ